MDALNIAYDALTKARQERDAAKAALFEAGVLYGDTLRQRDMARALVRRLINGILGGGIDQEYFAALKDARAAVKEWGPS